MSDKPSTIQQFREAFERMSHEHTTGELLAICAVDNGWAADELEERIRELRAINADLLAACKELLFAYQNKDAECPHQFETIAVAKANTAISDAEKAEGGGR